MKYTYNPPLYYTAFDLDGVIFPDIKIDWRVENIDNLLFIRKHLMPIFYPVGRFYIITGRPEEDRGYTEDWLKQWNIRPQAMFMNKYVKPGVFTDDIVIKHKSDTINELNKDGSILKFVESDVNQVREIQKLTNVHIVHFMDFVSKAIG